MDQYAALSEHLQKVPAKYQLINSVDDEHSTVYRFQFEQKEISIVWLKQTKKELFSTAVMYLEPASDAPKKKVWCRPLGSGPAFQSWDEDGNTIDEIYVSHTSFYPRGKINSLMAILLLEGLSWTYLSHPVIASNKISVASILLEIGHSIWVPGVTGPVWPKTSGEAENMIKDGRVKINGKIADLDKTAINHDVPYYWLQLDNLHPVKIIIEQGAFL